MKVLPTFENENQESEFWLNNDSNEFFDWSKSEVAKFENLKPTAKNISIRLPESLLRQIKIEANRKDIPYQALMKMILAEGLKKHQILGL